MAKRALVVWGGWDGHQPKEVGQLFASLLSEEGFEVDLATDLSALQGSADYDLLVPIWTMGEISYDDMMAAYRAVEAGVGMAGCHGGMCDAFRNSCEWQFMTGGQFVAHPGNDGTPYEVVIRDKTHAITQGLPDFHVESEQYYMHVDPSNHVLATTRFPVADGPHAANGPFEMPVAWTRMHGQGRVFYCSLGHCEAIVAAEPAREMMRRGFTWAAR